MNPLYSIWILTDMFLPLITCFVFCIDLCPCLIHCFTPLTVSKRNRFFLVTDEKNQHTATVQHVWDFLQGWRNGITSIALCYIWVDVLRQRVKTQRVLALLGHFWLSGTYSAVFKHSWWCVASGIGILYEWFCSRLTTETTVGVCHLCR